MNKDFMVEMFNMHYGLASLLRRKLDGCVNLNKVYECIAASYINSEASGDESYTLGVVIDPLNRLKAAALANGIDFNGSLMI